MILHDSTPRVLALDCSLRSTGVCYPDGTLDTLCPPKGVTGAERLEWFNQTFAVIFADHRPTRVVYEAPISGGRTGSIELHQLYGVLRPHIYQAGAVETPVWPSTLKKKATGKGNASKDDMLLVAVTLGYRPANHDEADAVLLAHGAWEGWWG